MKYSIVNGRKVLPFSKGQGNCPVCGSFTKAKCGKQKTWHWSHVSLQHCDVWWENETAWHRQWKSMYPEECQEIVLFDEVTGEKHIADVKTNSGLVIEFQNSPIDFDELLSRETFYKKMIWIVNGQKFKNNFHIERILPNPNCDFLKDIFFVSNGGGFYYKSEHNNDGYLVEIHSIQTIKNQIEENYIGHHCFTWKNARKVWYQSKNLVYLDFGDDLLWNLQKYDERGFLCVQAFTKRELVQQTNGIYQSCPQ